MYIAPFKSRCHKVLHKRKHKKQIQDRATDIKIRQPAKNKRQKQNQTKHIKQKHHPVVCSEEQKSLNPTSNIVLSEFAEN